jgi:hypothetical protein
MKLYFYFTLILVFVSVSSISQKISRSIIAPAGETSKTSFLILEWTVGESFVETNATTTGIYTQGFHQPLLEVQKINAKPLFVSKDLFNVYPNPVTSVVNLQAQAITDQPFVISVVDLNGKNLSQFNFPSKTSGLRIDMSRYSHGLYFLRITDIKGDVKSEYKIIKAL